MYPNNNNYYYNDNNKNIKTKIKKRRTVQRVHLERETILFFIFLSLLFKIYGNRILDFYRSRRQSWSTRRGLRVGTKILVFRQTPRGREFSYLCNFEPKGYVMAWNFLRCRKFQSQNFLTEFMNFLDYFRIVRAEFRDCFQTVRVEILGLYLDSSDIIFRNVFGCF